MGKVLGIFVLVLLVAGFAQAQPTTIGVGNPSFELPNEGKIKGWDMADGAYHTSDSSPAEVPSWESDGTINDSGVESGGTVGNYRGFLMYSDPEVYQTTSHIIQAGDIYRLLVDAGRNWNSAGIDLGFYSTTDGGVTRTPLTGMPELRNLPLDWSWTTISLWYVVPAGDPGINGNLGISLDNNTWTGDNDASNPEGWNNFDNVRLTLIPEPMTVALLGLGGLGLIRRRK